MRPSSATLRPASQNSCERERPTGPGNREVGGANYQERCRMDSPFAIALVPFFAVAVVLVFFGMRRVNCPDCGAQLPNFQSPFTKTRRQWLQGGFLCRNCGCETDRSGRKVGDGTRPTGP